MSVQDQGKCHQKPAATHLLPIVKTPIPNSTEELLYVLKHFLEICPSMCGISADRKRFDEFLADVLVGLGVGPELHLSTFSELEPYLQSNSAAGKHRLAANETVGNSARHLRIHP